MKIAFLSSIYLKHLEIIYEKYKFLEEKSYFEQYTTIRNESICSMGEWPSHFRRNNTETIMLCLNNPFQQKAWCRENHFTPKTKEIDFEIIVEQLKRFKPTHLFVFDVCYYSNFKRLEKIENLCPSLKVKIAWYGAPVDSYNVLRKYNLVITPSVIIKEELNRNGFNCEYLSHAFEPKVLDLISKKDRKNKLCFIGSLTQGEIWHEERIKYLESFLKEMDMDIYSEILKPSIGLKFKKKLISYRHEICRYISKYNKSNKRIKYYSSKKNLPIYDRIQKSTILNHIKPAVYGLDMMNLLSSYTLTFNMHIPLAKNFAGNMRLTEATGLGTCLLSDHKKNNKEYFGQFEEYCTYKTVSECVEKIIYLKNNTNLIKMISSELQSETLNKRSTTEQFNNLTRILKSA